MALWNPFNLFKKKEKPAAAPPVEAASLQKGGIEKGTIEKGTIEKEGIELAKPASGSEEAPPLPSVVALEATQTTLETVAATPITTNDSTSAAHKFETEATEPAAQEITPVVNRGPVERPRSESVPPTPSAEAPGQHRTQTPFVEQKAPTQPVDLAAKISRRPTTEKAVTKPKEEESGGGLIGWFRSAIRKTAQVLNTDIRDLVGRDGRLVDDEFLQELFTHLIKTDMGVAAATEIRNSIHSQYRGRKVHLNELINAAKTTIREIMKQEEVRLTLADQGTSVIMVVGVNGSGKTTSIAKLANMFRQDGKSVVLGAGDTFRAAAVEQLRQWAGRIGAEIVTGEDRSDPASVAFRAAKHAVEQRADICIVDTAGRLQTQSHLMQELAKIRRVIDKVVPGAPHETLLVLDSTAGQNAISQARGFSDAAGCTGIVLAKLDGTAKGGVAIPIRKEFNLPVKFIGFGETADAIAPFDVERYVDALFNID
ncbi:MAG: signal recognition particle-docking protein FtsY [Planctomycetaceae bacterium]|nr:signal recognition particle-docking protein FtsY [Planctomycetaceae bacterium]